MVAPAHLHHAWEIYNQFGRTSQALKTAVLSTGPSARLPSHVVLLTVLNMIPLVHAYHSVPIHLYDIIWLPLCLSLRTLRLRDPSAPRPHILQYHGRATITGRVEVASASQNAYVPS